MSSSYVILRVILRVIYLFRSWISDSLGSAGFLRSEPTCSSGIDIRCDTYSQFRAAWRARCPRRWTSQGGMSNKGLGISEAPQQGSPRTMTTCRPLSSSEGPSTLGLRDLLRGSPANRTSCMDRSSEPTRFASSWPTGLGTCFFLLWWTAWWKMVAGVRVERTQPGL